MGNPVRAIGVALALEGTQSFISQAYAANFALQAIIGTIRDMANVAEGSIQSLLDMTNAVANMEAVLGSSSLFSSQALFAERAVGAQDNMLTQMENRLARAEFTSDKTMDRFEQRVAAGGSRVADQMAQAFEDMQRRIAQATDQMVTQTQQLEDRRTRIMRDARERQDQNDADYARQREEREVAYNQRLEDMAKARDQRIRDLNQSIGDENESFADAEKRRHSDLQDAITTAEDKAADARAKIMAKYYAPKSAAEFAARDEELRLVNEELKIEEDKIKRKAADEEAAAVKAHDKKLRDLQQNIDDENQKYIDQTKRLKENNDQQARDSELLYQRQRQMNQQSLDDQVKAVNQAEEQVRRAYDKTISDAEYAYEKAQDRMVASAQGGARAITPPLTREAEALSLLGISLADFEKMDPETKFLTIARAIDKMPPGLDKSQAMLVLLGDNSITAQRFLHFLLEEIDKTGTGIGTMFTKEQQDNVFKWQEHVNEARFKVELFGAGIGYLITEKFDPLVTKFNDFIDKHGPQFGKILSDLVNSGGVKNFIDGLSTIMDDLGASFDLMDNSPTHTLKLVGSLKPVQDAFDSVVGDLKKISDFFDGLTKFNNDLSGFGMQIYQHITLPILDASTAIRTTFWNSVTEFGTHLHNTLVVPIEDFIRKIRDAVTSGIFDIFRSIIPYVPFLGRGSGGPVEAGQSYMVGEYGPERFIPSMSGQIIPATYNQMSSSSSYSSSSASTVVNVGGIHISGSGGGSEMGRAAGNGLIETLRMKGVYISGVN